jgi:hypothetical protein
MVQRNEASIQINKPIFEVWGFLSDLNNMVYFWSNIKEVQMVPDTGGGEVGTKYNLILPTVFGTKKVPIEITQKLATDNIEFKGSSQAGNILTGYKLTENEAGVMVTMYRESSLGPVASFITLDFLSARGAEVEFNKNLKKLKDFMERKNIDDSVTEHK